MAIIYLKNVSESFELFLNEHLSVDVSDEAFAVRVLGDWIPDDKDALDVQMMPSTKIQPNFIIENYAKLRDLCSVQHVQL